MHQPLTAAWKTLLSRLGGALRLRFTTYTMYLRPWKPQNHGDLSAQHRGDGATGNDYLWAVKEKISHKSTHRKYVTKKED